MNVLTVNTGSSSVKLRLLDADDELLESADAPFGSHDDDVRRAATTIASIGDAGVVAHRVVHGGTEFTSATVIDESAMERLRRLEPLAPLHQRNALALIEATQGTRPQSTNVACFDTAFHATLPAAASTYAIPAEWRSALGVRRYGFHGLSHDYASRRAAEMVGAVRERLRIVVCHLGSGASVCAVRP